MNAEAKELAKEWMWAQIMNHGRSLDDRDVNDYLDGLRQKLTTE